MGTPRSVRCGRDVLQLVTQIEPAGAQTLAFWLESALTQQGIPTTTGFLYYKSHSDLFDCTRAVALSRPTSVKDWIRLGREARRLLAPAPVVLAHTHYAIAMALALSPKSTPVVIVHHWPPSRYPLPARLLIGALRPLRRRVTEVFVSSSIASTGATVIANPVPEAATLARHSEDALHRTLDILIVARHAREKDLVTPIRGLVALPGRHLTLVGTGPQTQILRETADALGVLDRVDFRGTVPHPTVLGLMAGARVVALTSLWEAMPMTLLEAVAADADIIASDIEAHRFVIGSGAAVGFSPADPASFVRAVRLADQPEARRRLADGRQEVRLNQSEKAIAAQWAAVVQHAISGRAGRRRAWRGSRHSFVSRPR